MQLEEVKASIGIEAGVSEWLAVTQDLINEFAALTGDRQWIHVDPERARRESPFGTTVAHGFLTVALLSRLVSQAVDLRIESKMRVNYGFNRLRFPAPVPAGARIRARVTPNAVREVEGGIEIAWGVVVEVEPLAGRHSASGAGTGSLEEGTRSESVTREGEAKPALAAEWLVRVYF